MKCKLITIAFSILFFNPVTLPDAYSDGFKEKSWISILEKPSKLIGSGNLSFFGISLYKASLFSTSNFDHKNPFKTNFALEIQYFKSFRSNKIANTSRKEMHKLNAYNENDLNLWHKWMLAKFPDISKNDVLVGVFSPTFGIKIFHNNNFIAANNDIEFAKAFFSIWLNKDTSEPALRKKLLGINS